MCIIIAKEKYGRLPSEEELKNSFTYNSDGAGFMYVKNGKVVIDKGYMNYDAFIKHYKSLCSEFKDFKGKSLVIHCRIGTSGQKIKENTHPYPISNNTRMLRAKHLSKEDIGIVHNGVISGYGTSTGLNDTQEFISKYIYPIYSHFKDFYKNKDMLYGIEKITSSKFTILDKEDNLYFIGDFIDDNNLKFSNSTYKTRTYYGYYNDYDYYDSWYSNYYRKQEEIDKLDKEENYYYNEEDLDTDNLFELEKNWYVDLDGTGDIEKVGKRELYFDYETLELYEYEKGKYDLIAVNPIIYDENYEVIW